jgi:phosphoribosylaminoimidazolecarboxamide formyltransferase/IMP cyclohydrolase
MSTPHHASAVTVPVADPIPLRRVLVSVYDKAGLDQLAAALLGAGIEVVSTGGTSRALESHGVKVTDVATVTGFPEILDGRVKTLHPNVFAGLLYRRDRPDDIVQSGIS